MLRSTSKVTVPATRSFSISTTSGLMPSSKIRRRSHRCERCGGQTSPILILEFPWSNSESGTGWISAAKRAPTRPAEIPDARGLRRQIPRNGRSATQSRSAPPIALQLRHSAYKIPRLQSPLDESCGCRPISLKNWELCSRQRTFRWRHRSAARFWRANVGSEVAAMLRKRKRTSISCEALRRLDQLPVFELALKRHGRTSVGFLGVGFLAYRRSGGTAIRLV
jgi:hypothetical protein